MIRSIASGLVAGAIAAVFFALLETLFSIGLQPSAIAVSVGLMLPVGIFAGVGLLCFYRLLPSSIRPAKIVHFLGSSNNPRGTGMLLGAGVLLLLLGPVFYRTLYHFMTAYHHPGLAAFTALISLVVLAIAAGLTIRLVVRLTSNLFEFLGKKSNLFKHPILALGILITLWTVALLPPLMQGADAEGLFGFVGLVRKDGLGAGPLLSMMGLAILTSLILWPLNTKPRKGIIIVAGFFFALACVGPFFASSISKSHADTLDALDSGSGAIPLMLKLGRRASDKDGDGHGRLFGGLDCDDSNSRIHPGARDIPDNGIDEDCSGKDSNLAQLKAAVAKNRPPPPTQKRQMVRPGLPDNVSLLLITVDTLRWDAPGFMGNPRKITPNLDKVAARGTVYDRAYGLGSYTGQAVPPMLTGKYASELIRNDKHEVRISGKELFAAEEICKEGVKCAGFMTHFLFKSHYGWSQGFQEWEVVGADPPGPGHIDSKYNSHIVTNRAIKWLKDPQNTEGQFWLWVHYMDPHKEYVDHKGFKTFGSDRRSRYEHEVLFSDFHVGRLLDEFEKTGASNRTIVMVSADHGEAFNEHGRWCHGKELWEEIIRVPLVFAGPGIATKRIARQTSHIDIFPTLLDIFGRPIPEGIHGRSLLADWVEGQLLEERPIIADQPSNPNYETRRIFIDNGWKLHHLPDTGSYRLYEISEDYERTESLVKTNPEQFEAIKNAYELFCATGFKPIEAIEYNFGSIENMGSQ